MQDRRKACKYRKNLPHHWNQPRTVTATLNGRSDDRLPNYGVALIIKVWKNLEM